MGGALAAGRQDRRISRKAAPASAKPSRASIPGVSVGTAAPPPGWVGVGGAVGTPVGVMVGGVIVPVGVTVAVGVLVGGFVGVEVGVFVGGVIVPVGVTVTVGVTVGVEVGVLVGVFVGVFVGVEVGVLVGVFVGTTPTVKHWENSEVLLLVSVAVAVMTSPLVTATDSVALKAAPQFESVETVVEP